MILKVATHSLAMHTPYVALHRTANALNCDGGKINGMFFRPCRLKIRKSLSNVTTAQSLSNSDILTKHASASDIGTFE